MTPIVLALACHVVSQEPGLVSQDSSSAGLKIATRWHSNFPGCCCPWPVALRDFALRLRVTLVLVMMSFEVAESESPMAGSIDGCVSMRTWCDDCRSLGSQSLLIVALAEE